MKREDKQELLNNLGIFASIAKNLKNKLPQDVENLYVDGNIEQIKKELTSKIYKNKKIAIYDFAINSQGVYPTPDKEPLYIQDVAFELEFNNKVSNAIRTMLERTKPEDEDLDATLKAYMSYLDARNIDIATSYSNYFITTLNERNSKKFSPMEEVPTDNVEDNTTEVNNNPNIR